MRLPFEEESGEPLFRPSWGGTHVLAAVALVFLVPMLLLMVFPIAEQVSVFLWL